MKISPAIQLIMKAAANVSVRRVFNLDPRQPRLEIKHKFPIKRVLARNRPA